MSSINTPTYFVQHPDGSHTMANPQPIPEFEWQLKDGGPVHPCRIPTGGLHANNEPEPTKLHFGKSLRDEFAGLALPMVAKTFYESGVTLSDGTVPELCAKVAYQFADAMLKARNEGGAA